jgi:hypothetical protein
MLLMALNGGTFGDGAASGTTAVSLADILGFTREEYKQLDVKADAENTDSYIYIGDANVSATNAWVQLAAGESWGLNPASFTAPAGGDFKIDPELVFIVGAAVTDQAFVVALL